MLEAYWEITKPDGEKITFPSDSFLRASIEWMKTYAILSQAYVGPNYAMDITGANRQIPYNYAKPTTYHIMNLLAGDAGGSFGIVVGGSNLPNNVNMYALQAKIEHGSGAGQLYHKAVASYLPFIDGNDAKVRVTRDFTNVSTGDVSINEVGIYFETYDFSANFRTFCMCRDVLGTTIVVPPGYNVSVSFILKITVS
jgi:hypothetical protein